MIDLNIIISAFDYVVKERLLQRMNKLEIPQFLIN
jgi:hypothetical protein